MKLGITGHQTVVNQEWVIGEIRNLLISQTKQFFAITSLAVGADQIFALEALKCGGDLQVIIPFPEYNKVFDERGRLAYESLLSKAHIVEVMKKAGTNEEAYYEAGKRVVDLADLIVAVWNGEPAQGLGGTADIVLYAKAMKKPCIHINPVIKTIEYINWAKELQ